VTATAIHRLAIVTVIAFVICGLAAVTVPVTAMFIRGLVAVALAVTALVVRRLATVAIREHARAPEQTRTRPSHPRSSPARAPWATGAIVSRAAAAHAATIR